MVGEREERLLGPGRAREAVGHRLVGVRRAGAARPVAGEMERGLGRVRRGAGDLLQQGASLGRPAAGEERAAESHAGEIGLGLGAGSRAGRPAGPRAPPSCGPRRAERCRARGGGGALARRARGPLRGEPDEPRRAPRGPSPTCGYSVSSRSNAAAAAARSPRARCASPRSSRASGASRGQDAATCSRAGIAASGCPARAKSAAAFGSAAQRERRPRSRAGAEVGPRRGIRLAQGLLGAAEREEGVVGHAGSAGRRRARAGGRRRRAGPRRGDASPASKVREAGGRGPRELPRDGGERRQPRPCRRGEPPRAGRTPRCPAAPRARRQPGVPAGAGRGEKRGRRRGSRARGGRAYVGPRAAGSPPGEDPHQLVLEVVARVAHRPGNAVVVHLAAALDVLLEPLVDVPGLAPLGDLRLVVELDLAHHQAREALGVLVGLLVLGCDGARRRGSGAGRAAPEPGWGRARAAAVRSAA